MQYRAEIDGLRAISVIPVILFHIDMLSGGYLGVDVFFVISGYLITGIILEKLNKGVFTLADFYERRARRILPVLLLILLCTMPFAVKLLDKSNLSEYGLSVIAVCGFVSNFLFFQERDYFSDVMLQAPLLHTWSLAVEEQFYILYPLIIWGLYRILNKKLMSFFILSIIFSLISSQYLSTRNPLANFYLLPSRVWELMAGAVLAYMCADKIRTKNFWFENLTTSIALFILCACFYFFNRDYAHPGFMTVVPICATCILIWFTSSRTIVHKLLSNKILVGLGLISYSMYLWHVPLIVFLRAINYGALSYNMKFAVLPVTILLSYITWRYVEIPFRNSKFLYRTFVVKILLSFTIIACVLGTYIYFSFRNSRIVTFENSMFDHHRKILGAKCYTADKTIEINSDLSFCYIGDGKCSQPNFAVFGNSHAQVMYESLNEAANIVDKCGIFASIAGCAPIDGWVNRNKNPNECEQLRNAIYTQVKNRNIKHLIIISRWDHLLDNKLVTQNIQIKQIASSMKKYNDIGVTVHILLQVPKQEYNAQEIYTNATALSADKLAHLIDEVSVSKQDVDEMHALFYEFFESDSNSAVQFIDFTDLLCDRQECPIGTGEISYYRDYDHLNSIGARRLIQAWVEVLEGFE